MKTTIDEFYSRITDHILTIEGHLDDRSLGTIIRMCRLKPYDILSSTSNALTRYALKMHTHWVDEYGNSLHISNKRIRLVLNDLSIDRKLLRCTDLYDGLSIERIAAISKMAFATNGDEPMVCFLGLDEYARTFVWVDKWRKCSPLLLGMKRLREIAENKDIGYVMTCDGYWLMKLPMSSELIDDLGNEAAYLKTIVG